MIIDRRCPDSCCSQKRNSRATGIEFDKISEENSKFQNASSKSLFSSVRYNNTTASVHF